MLHYPMIIQVVSPDDTIEVVFADFPHVKFAMANDHQIGKVGEVLLLIELERLARMDVPIPLPSKIEASHHVSLDFNASTRVALHNALLPLPQEIHNLPAVQSLKNFNAPLDLESLSWALQFNGSGLELSVRKPQIKNSVL